MCTLQWTCTIGDVTTLNIFNTPSKLFDGIQVEVNGARPYFAAAYNRN